MSRTVTVYGLYDPREPKAICYVGLCLHTKRRLNEHLSAARSGTRSDTYDWIRAVQSSGVRPGVRVLETCPEKEGRYRENVWWWALKIRGHPVLNSEPGVVGPWPIFRGEKAGAVKRRGVPNLKNRGPLNGMNTHPEARLKIAAKVSGDNNSLSRAWAEKHGRPVIQARGDQHGMRTHPERSS